jgi:hypothetical protein
VRVLTAKWGNADRISPEGVVTGALEEPTAAVSDKPIFIYVVDESDEDMTTKIEKLILDNNKILVGMRVFKCVKMTPDDVANDPLLEVKHTPCLILVSRNYEKTQVFSGSKLKTSKVYDGLKKFARKAYKTNFDKSVKATLKLLNEFDKINNAKKALEAKKAKDDVSKTELAKIEKELAELAKRQKAADKELAGHSVFELRV